MTKIVFIQNKDLVANCGLYCGTCKRYLKDKCPGCAKNTKATWCKIRTCNIEHSYYNCADCKLTDRNSCKKLNNPIGKVFELLFRTDRIASLQFIQENGSEAYSQKMCSLGQMSYKKGQTTEP
jgi:hypothetical protein